MTDIDASGGSRAPHMLRDQTIHPGPGTRLVQSMSYGQNDEQPMPYKPSTPSLPAGIPDQSTLLYGNITAYPSTGSGVEGTHAFQLQDAQQQQLPESAPAPKTDPLELSLLASYLEVVRQTQGDAAAAEAMAASGADATAIGNALSNSPRLQQGAHSAAAADSSHLAVEQADGAVFPATADGPLAAVDDSLAVDNLLGFIKQRKLTGLPQGVSTGRRSSSGAASTASSASAAAAGAQQGPGAAGRKIWIQPSGELYSALSMCCGTIQYETATMIVDTAFQNTLSDSLFPTKSVKLAVLPYAYIHQPSAAYYRLHLACAARSSASR